VKASGENVVENRVRQLILDALAASYTSVSCRDAVKTGNHYQSINLGDVRTIGFRDDRLALLDKLDFRSKKVLDLGSNLGELSREASIRGARVVDGFEYDSFFVELANLITAYRGLPRVSFFERDITDAGSYREHYDVVLAFAVFHYIHDCLASIAEITDQALVIETHKLHGNFDSGYLRPICRFFPHYRMLGESDWGSGCDPREGRAIAVFAKTDSALRAVLKESRPGATAVVEAPAAEFDETGELELKRKIDLRRTRIQERFFEVFSFDSTDALLRAIRTTEVDIAALGASRDSRILGYSGWIYWFTFLKGYLEFEQTGNAGPGNVYYDYLVGHYVRDPGIARRLDDQQAAEEYIRRQFQDAELCARAGGDAAGEEIDPVRILVAEPGSGTSIRVFEMDNPMPLEVERIDGWHRLFSARVFGLPWLYGEMVEKRMVGPITGVVDRLELKDGRLVVAGWCIDPEGPVHSVELRADGRLLGVSAVGAREDVRQSFPRISHAHRSGFRIDCECDLDEGASQDFRLTAVRDWMPVGHIRAFYLPEMYEDVSWPPSELMKRRIGSSRPRRLAMRSVKCLNELVDAVGRYRALNSFRTVLNWGGGVGLLEPFIAKFVPSAEVLGLDSDPELIQWSQENLIGQFHLAGDGPPVALESESVDLVLAYSTLPRYTTDTQRQWLAELQRLLRSGGYAAITVSGEFAARMSMSASVKRDLAARGTYEEGTGFPVTYQTQSHAIDLVSRWFDVLTYVVGGVDERQDLIVLRKP
jgi:SAM-dependent methyltransferase